MKNISETLICSLLLLLISHYSFSQTKRNQYDSIIVSALSQHLNILPDIKDTGAIILKILKKGTSIKVTLVYATHKLDQKYNVKYYDDVSKNLTTIYKPTIKVPFELIVPVYFSSDAIPLSKEAENEVAMRLEKLKKQGLLITTNPLTLVSSEGILVPPGY